jgi:GNAT superfamily N-acetyltransferase
MSTDIRELTTESEWRKAFPVIEQLRGDLTEAEYLDLLGEMREEGYRLFGAFDGDDLVTAAGVAVRTNFYNGKHVFVYDLVTRADRRSEGYGEAMMTFLESWAQDRDCEYVTLESALRREDAHRFYEDRLDMNRFCYTFRKELDG